MRITKSELKNIKELIDDLIFASNKAEGKKIKQKLEFHKSTLDGVEPYELGKLSEAIDYAFQASGQVQDKEHWKDASLASWYVFEKNITRSN